MALQHVRHFNRQMAQPVDQVALQSVLLTIDEVEKMSPQQDVLIEKSGEGGAMLTETVK